MRNMKDSGISWVGDIPASWNVKRGKTIMSIINRPIMENDGVITCFRDGEVTLRSNRREEGYTVSIQEAGYQGIEPGDLVVHGMDGFAGSIGISDSRGKASPVLNVLDSNENKRYLMYYLRSAAYCGLFLSLATGIRIRTCDTNWNKLKDVLCVVPSISEQNSIASYIDLQCARIDNSIEKTKASIEEYKKLKQAIITQVVTTGMRGDRPMKDSGIEWIEKIPDNWNVMSAFQCFTPIKNKNIGLTEKNLLSLSYGKIKRKSIDTVEGLLPESFETYNIVDTDDIVLRLTDLQNDHKSLRVGIATERGIITSAYVTIKNTSDNNSRYLYYYLHSFDIAKGFYGMGSGVRQGLNWDELKHLKICCPPQNEQLEIVSFLDQKSEEIDNLISKKEAFLAELGTYKRSMIYEYVTGKKEVKV